MARVVVTGGNGFIGSHLVDRLLRRGDEVVVFDSQEPHPRIASSWEGVEEIRGSVCSPDQLAAAIRPGVDVVYHLAAVVGVDRYLASPLDVIDVNFTGTRNVLDLAERTGAKVVLASTSELFGKNPAVPWKEDADRILGTTEADRWSYSSSKALAEHLTFGYMRQRGLNASIIRYFNVYGPRQRVSFLVSRSVVRALRGEAPVVYDQGRQTRCFTYIDDAVEASVRVLDHAPSGRPPHSVFNVGNHQPVALLEYIALLERALGKKAIKEMKPMQPGDVPATYADTRALKEATGYAPATPLEAGLARFAEWFKNDCRP